MDYLINFTSKLLCASKELVDGNRNRSHRAV